ncbi:hypothetical protein VYU27_009221, partial [Nannochloropsis oceanica]
DRKAAAIVTTCKGRSSSSSSSSSRGGRGGGGRRDGGTEGGTEEGWVPRPGLCKEVLKMMEDAREEVLYPRVFPPEDEDEDEEGQVVEERGVA